MNLEGKVCGVCNKGRLHAFKDEVVEGVYVDAYRCDYGHASYTASVMKKVESLFKAAAETRHVVRVGSSVAVPIPASIVKLFGLKPKERVYVTTQGNRILILPTN